MNPGHFGTGAHNNEAKDQDNQEINEAQAENHISISVTLPSSSSVPLLPLLRNRPEQNQRDIWRRLFARLVEDIMEYEINIAEQVENDMIAMAENESLQTCNDHLFNKDTTLTQIDLEETTGSFAELRNDQSDESCSICMEKFSTHDACYQLGACKHIFHCECLHEAVRHQHQSCPTCRQPLVARHHI
jgi:hypothetical protein